MKKSQLKQALKPLVKECVKEVMFEEGVLSSIVSEVARGLGGVLSEHQQVQAPPQKTKSEPAPRRRQSSKLQEHKNKLMTAIGEDSYNGVNLFEGTTPAPSELSPSQPANPLLNQSPEDPGVDINDLLGSVGTHWNAHMNDVK